MSADVRGKIVFDKNGSLLLRDYLYLFSKLIYEKMIQTYIIFWAKGHDMM